jgi:hypothetical protein
MFCVSNVHFSKTYCFNVYDEKYFPDVKEHVLLNFVQWTQNNSKLQLHHCKRREDGMGKGLQEGKESLSAQVRRVLKHFSAFNFDSVSGIFKHWLLFYSISSIQRTNRGRGGCPLNSNVRYLRKSI